ncbi:MAG: hypothetical protein GX410_08485, partial [Elusimicrobia bacterium]|nr:hypothetical protein [Elusimicrobiota bacterium]
MFSNYIPLRWNRKTALAAALALTLLALYPCLFNGFTNWDDGNYLLDNPQVRNFTPGGLAAIFTSLHSGLYKPLVFVSFALEYHFFGFNPFVYHGVNLLFHLASCALVFLLVERLAFGTWAAFAVALVFGVHPMHVESVAWVSERKDMLYAFFFLLSLLLYLRYRRDACRPAYWCAVGAYLLSLLAKPFGVALPILLFLVDWYENRSRDRAFWLDKLPFLFLALVFAGFAVFSVKQSGVLFDGDSFGPLDKLQLLSYSLLFYAGKFFWPAGLSVIYPYPARNAAGAFPSVYAFSP